MATATRIFNWDSDAESWTFAAANGTGTWLSSGGNPTGCLQVDLAGKNLGAAGSWWLPNETSGQGVSWETMFSIPAGSTVTRLHFNSLDYSCTVYNTPGVNHASGEVYLYSSTNVLLASLRTEGVSFSGTTGWLTDSTSTTDWTGSDTSATLIKIRYNPNIQTGNSKSADLRLLIDNLSLTVTYTAGSNIYTKAGYGKEHGT